MKWTRDEEAELWRREDGVIVTDHKLAESHGLVRELALVVLRELSADTDELKGNLADYVAEISPAGTPFLSQPERDVGA